MISQRGAKALADVSKQNSSTIDSNEVHNFNRLASQWWQKDGPFWPLHKLNKIRVEWILNNVNIQELHSESINQPLNGLKVLDIGCGGGILSESLAKKGALVHGIDVVEKNITIAQQHATKAKLPIRYECIDVESLVMKGKQYDVVFNMEVVEHVNNVSVFMKSCAQLVREDGLMFVSTINRTWVAWLTTIVGAEYVLKWLPRGTHQYHKFVTPSEMDVFLNLGLLQSVNSVGVGANPLTKRLYLRKSKNANYMICAKKLAPNLIK